MEDNIYYVYGYYTNNIPIYIGRGKDNRAYNHLKLCYRTDKKHLYFYNKLRKLIENKENIEIKIIKENLSFNESKYIEEILIEFCGRKDLRKGTLYNLTDGGEGAKGYKCSDEKIERMKILTTIRNSTPEYKKWFIETISPLRHVKIIQYSKNGKFIKIWDSITQACNHYNLGSSSLHVALDNTNKTAKNFRWEYYKENYSLILKPIKREKRKEKKQRKILCTSKNGISRIFTSAKEAALELKTKPSCIRAVCINSEKRTQHRGYKFEYI